jgi:predicted porin
MFNNKEFLMKKIALATILAAVSIAASAQVTVYGKLRVYEESSKVGSADAITALTNDSSRIGFKGTEALSNGLSANFTIETGIGADAPAATTLGDRTMQVGLSNALGSISVGRDKHAIARTLDNYDAMGNVYGSSVTTIHTAQGSRLSNALFASGTFIPGLTVNYQNSNSEAAGVTNGQAGSIEFTRGPIAATVAYFDNGTTSTTTIAGAKYNVAKTGTTVFAMYSDDKVAGVKSTGTTIGVNQPLNASMMALASYGQNDSAKAYDLGVTYNLSKRTMVHARYVKEDAVATTTKYALGMEHNF